MKSIPDDLSGMVEVSMLNFDRMVRHLEVEGEDPMPMPRRSSKEFAAVVDWITTETSTNFGATVSIVGHPEPACFLTPALCRRFNIPTLASESLAESEPTVYVNDQQGSW